MQIRIERIDPHSGRTTVVRLKTPGIRTPCFKAMVRAPEPPIRAVSESLRPPQVAPLTNTAEDSSPAARARRTRRRLRRQFEQARRAAKGQVRLCRADEYVLL